MNTGNDKTQPLDPNEIAGTKTPLINPPNADDLVHENAGNDTPEPELDIEKDPDEIVHEQPIPPADPSKEQDPDDLVHGK